MNLVKGARRIYIVFVCAIGIGLGVVWTQDIPSTEKIVKKTENLLWSEIRAIERQRDYAENLKYAEYGLPPIARILSTKEWGYWDGKKDTQTNNQYMIYSLCSPQAKLYKEVKETANICSEYKNELQGLTLAQVKFALTRLGALLVFFVGAALFWLLLAWMGNGFISDKKSTQ